MADSPDLHRFKMVCVPERWLRRFLADSVFLTDCLYRRKKWVSPPLVGMSGSVKGFGDQGTEILGNMGMNIIMGMRHTDFDRRVPCVEVRHKAA